MGYERLNQNQWSLPPWEFEVATKFAGRFSSVHQAGFNASVGTSFEDIWNVGGSISYLASAEQMNISSTSASDASVGVGAQKIILRGLDTNHKEVAEEITLNGVSIVTTTTSFIRISKMFITDVGAEQVNLGNITATAAISATIQGRIDTDVGQTLMALSTVPDGFFAMVTSIQMAATGLNSALIDFQAREDGKGWRVLHRDNLPSAVSVSSIFVPLQAPLLIGPRADIKIRGLKVGAGTTIISANYSYYLIDKREIRL